MDQYKDSIPPEAVEQLPKSNTAADDTIKMISRLAHLEQRVRDQENEIAKIQREVNRFKAWQSHTASILNKQQR